MFEGIVSRFLEWRANLTFRWFEANHHVGRAFSSALFPPSPSPATNDIESSEDEFGPVRDPSREEIDAIERSLSSLVDAGIKLGSRYRGMSLQEVADEIAAGCEILDHVTGGSENLTSTEWADIILCQMRDGPDYEGFDNAIYIGDHCFDGADEDAYRRLVRRIISLTGRDWRIKSVRVQGRSVSRGWFVEGEPVSISIDARPQLSSFQLVHGKDFDWSLIDRLNERPPSSAIGRFALKFIDQTIVIVYLPQDGIDRLNTLSGGFDTTAGKDYSGRFRA